MTAWTEFRRIRRLALAQGWRVRQIDTAHYEFLSPDRAVRPVYVSDGHGDPRTIHNVAHTLRRSGLAL